MFTPYYKLLILTKILAWLKKASVFKKIRIQVFTDEIRGYYILFGLGFSLIGRYIIWLYLFIYL